MVNTNFSHYVKHVHIRYYPINHNRFVDTYKLSVNCLPVLCRMSEELFQNVHENTKLDHIKGLSLVGPFSDVCSNHPPYPHHLSCELLTIHIVKEMDREVLFLYHGPTPGPQSLGSEEVI